MAIGKCLCGSISFEADVSNVDLYQCHCSLCRRQSGAASNAATSIPLSAFRWLSGTSLITSWVKDTGFRSDFCSKCGSPVPNPLRGTDLVWIPAGLLEGNVEMRVVAHIHVASSAAWDPRPDANACLVYDGDPKLDEFLAALWRKHR